MTDNVGFDVNTGGTRLVIVQLVFLSLAWIVSILRGYVKVFMVREVTLDDWLMLIALLAYTTYGVIVVHGVVLGGTGRHTTELNLEGIGIALRAWYLCEVIYVPLAALIRTSIALFLYRLVVESWHVWVIRVNLVVIWTASIGYFFITVFQCYPPSFFWEGPSRVPGAHGSCPIPDLVPLSTYAHSALSALSDWVLGLLPIFMLWHVRLNLRTKIGVAVLLSMGMIAGLALMVRIPYIKRIAVTADFLYETIEVAIFSVLEPSLGILAGSAACLRPLFKGFGFGFNHPTSKFSSKKIIGSGSRGWHASRSMKRLDDNTTNKSTSRSVDVHLKYPNNSEIELQRALAAPGRGNKLFHGTLWDIETGRGQDMTNTTANGISVQTSIDVTSRQRSSLQEQENSDESSSTNESTYQENSLRPPPSRHTLIVKEITE